MTALSTLLQPLRLADTLLRQSFVLATHTWRSPVDITSQAELARLVERTSLHRIRAGRTHRFIDLMFVTVGDRVFCRRYTYGEPSWRTVFLGDSDGQVWLDGTTVNIAGTVPADLDAVNPAVNDAYAEALRQRGASFMLGGAIDDRAMASTMEMTFVGS